MGQSKPVFFLLLACFLLNAVLVWTLPFLIRGSIAYPALRLGYASICHQRVDRTICLLGNPVFVCARCAAIYTGLAAGLLAAVSRRLRTAASFRLLMITVAIMLGEAFAEMAGVGGGNWMRLAASLPFGLIVGTLAGRFLLE